MTGIVQFVSYNVFVKHIRGMSQVFQYIYIAEKLQELGWDTFFRTKFSEDDFPVYFDLSI